MSTFLEDFDDECGQTVLIQSWVSNNGYKDVFSEAVSVQCSVSYKIQNIIKSDGTEAMTTCQIYVDGDVVVNERSRITINGKVPKILKVSVDYDIEYSDEIYGIIIYT